MATRPIPKTIESIYADFKSRREGLINALTTDADEFYKQCSPDRENLCLYGEPDGTWRVDLPAEEVPPELPEPVLGINFARDGLERKDWLALCAVHSDAWLMAVVFFYAVRFDDAGRAELYALVNQHPTVYEVVTGRCSRNKINKKRNVSGARARPTGMAVQQPVMPAAAFPIGEGVSRAVPTGRTLSEEDINASLEGRQGEMLWPDDGKWYLISVQSVDPLNRRANIVYATGEIEEVDLDEVLLEGHMRLL